MIERLKAAYTDNNRVKLAALAGLLLCAVIFAVLSGGFPPWAWRFLLFNVLPSLPRLQALKGGVVFLPLLGLILLSLALLIIWAAIVTSIIKVGTHLWQDYRSSQNFSMDLQEAEELAERNIASDQLDRWIAGTNMVPTSMPGFSAGPTRGLHASMTETMPAATTSAANAPQRREYATSGRPVRVSGGGMIFPETPTPAMNPTFMAPVAPAPVMRQANPPWIQQERRQYSRQDSSEGSQQGGRGGGQSMQGGRASTYPTNTTSLPAFNPPTAPLDPAANPARRPLRIVPPPEEIADDEPSIDKAFSALLEREQADQPSRYPTRPERAEEVENHTEDHTSDLTMPLVNNGTEQTYLSMLEELAGNTDDSWLLSAGPHSSPDGNAHAGSNASASSDVYADSSTDDNVGGSIYDTVPIDESKVTRDELDGAPRLVVGIGLDPGIKRRDAPNEDSIFAIQGMRITDNGSLPAGLFVVADGMGGHANGREASRMAIHTVSDVIVPALLRDVSGRDAAEEETLFQDMLKDGVHRANLAIYRRNRELPEMMGTTLTAALIANSTAYVGNVGDSRTYLYRPSEGLQQVTRDHSEVARMVEAGAIAPEEIYTHPKRNRIYRCLGERASVEMDAFVVPLEPGDVLILCSDGLWEMVRDSALEKIVTASAHNPAQLSAILVQAALNHGGVDNISVVAIGFLQGKE